MVEPLRKSVHVILGTLIIVPLLLNKEYLSIVMSGLFALLIASISADYLIADRRIKLPLYQWVERAAERKGFHASTYYIIGIILTFTFFPLDIALAANAMMIYGDPAAALLREKRKKTTTEIITMFFICTVVGLAILKNIPLALSMAAVATIVEHFVRNIDDNLVIPLFTGLAGLVLTYIIS